MEATVEDQSIEVLELPLVLEMAGRQTMWSRGRDLVLALRPAPSREEVLDRQADLSEAIHLDQIFATPPLRGLRDVREKTEAACRGQVLEPVALLDIGQVLRVTLNVRRFLQEHREHAPRMAGRANGLVTWPHVLEEIETALTSDGEVRETASARLEEIRIKMRTLQNRIQTRLQSILRNPAYGKMFQEPYITTRQDRYVLPVKAEYRSVFQGLVLDASASGATVFMEPFGVVDMDNELRELRSAEAHEIERILRALSQRVAAIAEDMTSNDQILAHLDMLMAIARFAAEQRARLVPVDESSHVLFRAARHPLLGGRAVPIDVEVGRSYRIVIMTGPNTGGKTVTLKTIGLLSLMAMCGLPIPVGDGSRIGFLRGVYADIGDEQSIQQNLSTFSSHLTQISRIAPRAGENTLVLLDEVGAGTDPREGTGLAVAILEYLYAHGAMVVATTHYNELKTFASNFEGAMNAAMEFDPRTLLPTYRILMGIPGRSCALEISEGLGLSPEILERARELLGAAHFSVEDLLANLEVEREEADRRHSLARQAHAEADALRARLGGELGQLELERAQIRAAAAREAEALVNAAREEARRVISDARGRLSALYQKVPHARGQAAAAPVQEKSEVSEELAPGESLPSAEAMRLLDEEEARVRVELGEAAGQYREAAEQAEAEQKRLGRKAQPDEPEEASGAIRPGDSVFVKRLRQEATVADVGRNEVQVLVGKLRMTLPRSEVRKTRSGSPLHPSSGEVVIRGAGGQTGVERRANVSTRLDLRGFRAEDAAYEVDRYLDEVAAANVDRVTIVHGKGTGVLLNVVQERLRAHPRVDSFRLGDQGEGGWGVTVVTLK